MKSVKSAAKKRRTDHGAAWSDESEASLVFFKQGEANAAAELAAYEREIVEAARPRGIGRRRWLLAAAAAALALIAVLLYVASS